MKTERYECDREGCHVVSNGNTAGWWAMRCQDRVVGVGPLQYVMENLSNRAWTHYCGTAHALAAVSEAMEKMQERTP